MPFLLLEMRVGRGLHSAEVLNVTVGAEARVVGQVEAVVVGIFVDNDLVSAPIPIVAEAIVGSGDAESETAEPEAFTIAAFDTPHVAGTEAAGEASMGPRMIEMKVRIVAAGVMAYPFAV